MYAKNKQPIKLEELDYQQFITLRQNNEEPLIKLLFSINTPYLQRDFYLDLIIWNLSDDNMEITKKVVYYVLKNFSKLFETGWTALYHYSCLCNIGDVAEHTLKEFYEEQIDFEYPYYSIQLEINCEHLSDGAARYCFVVATISDYQKWMISDDNMRVYMNGNKACSYNTNNDDTQILDDLEDCHMMYEAGGMMDKAYEKMNADHFQYAEIFDR